MGKGALDAPFFMLTEATLNDALTALKDYQIVLNRISELEKLLSFVPEDVQVLENEWQTMKERLAELVARHEEQSLTQKTQDTALAEATEKSKKFEKDLNEVTNSKEYNAVIKEIDAIRKRVSSLNDDITKRMVDLEEITKNIDECKQLASQSKSKYQSALRKYRATQSEFKTELESNVAERDKKAALVPESLMRQFARIADRRQGIGLALCVDSICSACNVHIRSNVVEMIRHNQRVIKCDSCQRILYFHEEALTS